MATSTSTSSTPTSTSDGSAPSCTTAVPGKYGNVPATACNSYYNFDPSFGAAVAVSVIFGVLTAAHLAEAVVFRKRYAWVLIMGALWETIAFVTGALGAHDQQSSGLATAHQLLFLLAPLWINAFVYMTFSRMVYCFLPDGRVWAFRATGMSKWFVWADFLSFVIQAVGGVMTSPGSSNDVIQTGLHVYMAGIGCQEFFILFFLGLMVVFHRKALQHDVSGYHQAWNTPEGQKRSWKGLLYALYTVLTFISLRIFYRLAEYGGGISPSNPIPFHEAYSYALDAFPMMVCLLTLCIMHPGRALVGPKSDLPRKTRAEKKAEKARKKEEKARKKAEKNISKDSSTLELAATDFDSFTSHAVEPQHTNWSYPPQ